MQLNGGGITAREFSCTLSGGSALRHEATAELTIGAYPMAWCPLRGTGWELRQHGASE